METAQDPDSDDYNNSIEDKSNINNNNNNNDYNNNKNNNNNTKYTDLVNFNNFVTLNYNKKKLLSIPYILNGKVFEILKLDENTGSVRVRCLICPENNVYKGNVKSTGNFHMHIKRKHPLVLPIVNDMKQQSNNDRKVIPRRRNLSNGNVNGCPLNKRHKPVKREKCDSVNPYILDSNEPIDYRPPQKKGNTNNIVPSTLLNMNQKPGPDAISPSVINSNQSYNGNQSQPLPAHLSNYLIKKNKITHQTYPTQYCNRNQEQSEFSGESVIKAASYLPGFIEQNATPSNQDINLLAHQSEMVPQSNNAQYLTNLFPATIQETLLRVENHLKGIEREMNLRNQIETNKIYLELAKFKYLNPGFK